MRFCVTFRKIVEKNSFRYELFKHFYSAVRFRIHLINVPCELQKGNGILIFQTSLETWKVENILCFKSRFNNLTLIESYQHIKLVEILLYSCKCKAFSYRDVCLWDILKYVL
jgi:hypothetical protein